MKTFKKFVESYEPVNEAEFNSRWWDSKSDSFKKRYIERHPNSIYAKKFGNGKLDKQIASKKYHADADKKRRERDVAGNKAWMNLLAKQGLDKDRKGGKPIEALTPRYRKNLIRGAEEVYGKDSKQAARARELWGDAENNKSSSKKEQPATLDSVKEKYGKRYQNIEDFVSNYDVEQFSKAAADYAYDVADGPDDVENHFDDFDGEYSVDYKDLANKMKKKFGFTPDRDDIAAILNKVGGKVKLV